MGLLSIWVRDTLCANGEQIDFQFNKRADAFLQYGWIVELHRTVRV